MRYRLSRVAAVVLLAAQPYVATSEPSKLQGGPEPGRAVDTGLRPDTGVQLMSGSDFDVRQAATVTLPQGGGALIYASPEGRFTVTLPPTCSRLDKRANFAEEGEPEVAVRILALACEVAGIQIESRLGAARGLTGRAAGELVAAEVRRLVAARRAQPVRQRALHEDYGERGTLDGFEIEARPRSGQGELQVRGLLHGEDIYILVAWRPSGHVWSDGDYIRFFSDFRPWAEERP